ncbi:hypothetical protein [Aestuariivirga sp.]|uniref:hypothetical protein n=1 Tax=Aestuariivirga sp. TaxID=2650926 RepID=UPI0039E24841
MKTPTHPVRHAPIRQFLEQVARDMFNVSLASQIAELASSTPDASTVDSITQRARYELFMVVEHVSFLLQTKKVIAQLCPVRPGDHTLILNKIEKWAWDRQKKAVQSQVRMRRLKRRRHPEFGIADYEEEEEEEEEDIDFDYKHSNEIIEYTKGAHYKPRHFDSKIALKICNTYWENEDAVLHLYRPTPTVALPSSALMLDADGGSPFKPAMELAGIDIGLSRVQGWLQVRNPSDAIDDCHPPVSEVAGWGATYKNYERVFWPEIIAWIWRNIAVNQRTIKHGIGQAIFRDLDAYFDYGIAHGAFSDNVRPSAKTLQEVISRIVEQWEGGTKSNSLPVLVNSGNRQLQFRNSALKPRQRRSK